MSLVIQYIVNGIIAGSIYALLATSFSIIFATTRIFHLAHTSIFAMSGLITWFLFSNGWPIWIAIIVSLCVGAVVGMAMELAVYRPMRRRGAPLLIVMIASLGILIFIQNLLAILFSPTVQFFPVFIGPINIGSILLPGWQLVTFILALGASSAILLLLRYTRLGAEIQAVASNKEMSRVVDININRIYVITFGLGSILVALAGSVVAIDTGANPYSGLIQLLTAVIIMILGGISNIKGIINVSFLFGLLENISLLVVTPQWKTTVTFAIFIVLVLSKSDSRGLLMEKVGGEL